MTTQTSEKAVEFPPYKVPARWHSEPDAKATIVLLPAMGVPAGFYTPFADALCEKGYAVLVSEIPGTGESRPRPSRTSDYGYVDLAERYLPALVGHAAKCEPQRPVVLLGHSLGAQLATLALGLRAVDVAAMVSVAGGHIHYRNWSGMGAAQVRSIATLFPLLAKVFGYLPGQHVGFGGPQAQSLINDWSTIIRTGQFSALAPGFQPPAVPALCVGIEGDHYAPPKSIESLASLLGGESDILPNEAGGNPHSSWARKPKAVANFIHHWLSSTL